MPKPMTTKAGHPTSAAVVKAIETLHDALTAEYGVDFSYSVSGKGHIVGAHNILSGYVWPTHRK